MSESVLNPQQLQMFMRPGEILAKTEGRSVDYGDYPGRTEAMLRGDVLTAAKRHHDDGPSVYESVKSGGVEKPVILSPGNKLSDVMGGRFTSRHEPLWMGNGHHRVASALAAEQETGQAKYIPVIHDTDYMGTRQTRRTFGVAED